ncbi:MAG TPA: cytochrome c [Candidatus Acidoferrales bacterium]
MRPLLISTALALISLAAAGAAARNRGVDRRGVLAAIAQAPAKARTWKNPYDNQPDGVDAGAKLYRQHCAECHGDDARGIGHAADLHSTGVQNATPGELVWFLRNGNLASGMPSWSGLPEQRRWQIVAYLKTLN